MLGAIVIIDTSGTLPSFNWYSSAFPTSLIYLFVGVIIIKAHLDWTISVKLRMDIAKDT